MVTVRKRVISGKTYYYLEHSLKVGGRVEKREKYLGTSVPKDIEGVKKDFLNQVYQQKWFAKLETIKKSFTKEFKRLPPSAAQKYFENFMIRFTYNTNRIEGSTLTLRETANLLEEGITPANKPVADVKEAESHKQLFYRMLAAKEIDHDTILRWHKLLLENTKPDIAGRIRNYQVGISNSEYMPPTPLEVPPLFKEFFRWYNKEKNKLHPVELAAIAHQKFVTIHPFGDGNGRISRIIMNFILHKHDYPMLNIPYTNRSSYYTALERSQTKQQEYIFVQYLIKKYIKTYTKYLKEA